MKKNATLKIIEQSDKVCLYSICFEADGPTEFEHFMQKFETEGVLNRDYQKIIIALQIILKNGAFERYFRPEGSIGDGVCALPLASGKIRLYCLRLTDQILIVGNGGVKRTKTYQEDKHLLGYVLDLQRFDTILQEGINNGTFSLEEKTIIGIEDQLFKL